MNMGGGVEGHAETEWDCYDWNVYAKSSCKNAEPVLKPGPPNLKGAG